MNNIFDREPPLVLFCNDPTCNGNTAGETERAEFNTAQAVIGAKRTHAGWMLFDLPERKRVIGSADTCAGSVNMENDAADDTSKAANGYKGVLADRYLVGRHDPPGVHKECLVEVPKFRIGHSPWLCTCHFKRDPVEQDGDLAGLKIVEDFLIGEGFAWKIALDKGDQDYVPVERTVMTIVCRR